MDIQWASFFSVSLFILMMGVTTWIAYCRRGVSIKRPVWGILRPYIIATLIFCIFQYCVVGGGVLDLGVFWSHLLAFNASGPHYYVLLYIQLALIAPAFLRLLKSADDHKKCGWLIEIVGFAAVLAIAWATTNYTRIGTVYGGGGKFLGGTYLIPLYLGMWFSKHFSELKMKAVPSGILTALCLSATVGWCRFIIGNKLAIDKLIPLGQGVNPPSVSLLTYSILVALTLFFVEKLLENLRSECVHKTWSALGFLGRHTLYIFLYHRLFIDFGILNTKVWDDIWLKRIVFFAVMIVGSLILEYVLELLHGYMLNAFHPRLCGERRSDR